MIMRRRSESGLLCAGVLIRLIEGWSFRMGFLNGCRINTPALGRVILVVRQPVMDL